MAEENKFEKATSAVQNKARGAVYKKGLARVDLTAEFKSRDIDVHKQQQIEK